MFSDVMFVRLLPMLPSDRCSCDMTLATALKSESEKELCQAFVHQLALLESMDLPIDRILVD